MRSEAEPQRRPSTKMWRQRWRSMAWSVMGVPPLGGFVRKVFERDGLGSYFGGDALCMGYPEPVRAALEYPTLATMKPSRRWGTRLVGGRQSPAV
ncbi:hypothetical protein [Edaphobacter albus]|uniref:hypothetical protein n=1 Tax=Edaphobacter sp. 4G125 TaxID=2763071 RepID=UPI00164580C4|nr:hypothetical protein [Edaphobacter sp. 4G125]QNI36015.1 hypothetical protein H7846_13540 [Edaphobacter sp. 4G125]